VSDGTRDASRPLRVLVVDDEPLGRQRLLDLIARDGTLEVIGAVADGGAAVAAIRSLAPDLVFLDVHMPQMSGLEVLREIGAPQMPATVFVTAYDQYAVHAFEAAAVDYLVKPFTDARFDEAVNRVRRQIGLARREQMHEALSAHLHANVASPSGHRALVPAREPGTPGFLERIAVQMRGKMRIVPVAELDYISASGQYAELHAGQHRYFVRDSMQRLEERLDPAQFVRIHRSVIVRLSLIRALLRSGGSEYQVELAGGLRLPVGRSRREALEHRLGRAR
jgi:two-component system, LytTR family, response regulator